MTRIQNLPQASPPSSRKGDRLAQLTLRDYPTPSPAHVISPAQRPVRHTGLLGRTLLERAPIIYQSYTETLHWLQLLISSVFFPSQEAEDESFDWFQTIDLVPLVQRFVPDTNARIGMLGCGNSLLWANLYDKGYHSIVNLDYSPISIDKMEKIHSATRPEMTWQTADVRALSFADETFDVCIDKDPWTPPDQVIKDRNDEIDQVVRVLSKPNGVFFHLTWGQPHFRKQYLLREGWLLETVELGDGFCYYLYVLRRKDRDDKTKAP